MFVHHYNLSKYEFREMYSIKIYRTNIIESANITEYIAVRG